MATVILRLPFMNAKILGAFVIGAGLISASLYGVVTEKSTPASAAVIVAAAPERSYIAIADANNNGIADWRETLRTVQTISLDSGTTTAGTYTPPDTLTGQMAIALFKDTVEAKQYGVFDEQQGQIVDNFEKQIQAAAVDDLYTFRDIAVIDDTNREALFAYGNKVAEIALVHAVPVETENEALITKQAVERNNPETLAKLAPIKKSYEGMLGDMLTLEVPRSLADDHVYLLNAYNALAIDIAAMEASFTDPLYTMTRLKRYQDDTKGLYYALVNLYTNLEGEGISYKENDLARQVFGFINLW